MAAKVKTVNPPPKAAPVAPTAPVPPKSLCYGDLNTRLTACSIHEKSPVRVKMTVIETLFGSKRELYFGVRDVIITVGASGKPDLVELVVQ